MDAICVSLREAVRGTSRDGVSWSMDALTLTLAQTHGRPHRDSGVRL